MLWVSCTSPLPSARIMNIPESPSRLPTNKILPPPRREDGAAPERQLGHPGAVGVHDVGVCP